MKYHINPSKLAIHDKVVKLKKFYDNGQLWCEKYYLNGKLHNPNGPAYQAWHENGQLRREEYYLNGKLHNPNGPAVRDLRGEYYYLNGNPDTIQMIQHIVNGNLQVQAP